MAQHTRLSDCSILDATEQDLLQGLALAEAQEVDLDADWGPLRVSKG